MQFSRFVRPILAALAAAAILAPLPAGAATKSAPAKKGTPAEAKAFLDKAEAEFLDVAIEQQRAAWVKSNFITDDTETLEAKANERMMNATVRLAAEATRFDGLKLPESEKRKLALLKLALVLPAPADSKKAAELARIAAGLEGTYGKGKYCPPADSVLKGYAEKAEGGCLDLGALSKIIAESRNEKELREAWVGWHKVSPPMRKDYARLIELANEGSRGLGFKDVGALWRSKYDMNPDEFAREVDRLWEQVRPLYESLHAYVRTRLREKYGPEIVSADGPIPAHLLGNMWSQAWGNVWDVVKPAGDVDPGYDLTKQLEAKGYDAKKMAATGEAFFTSLGFPALPKSFWERSLFTKPRDRDVVCHASAWDIDFVEDIRIKMCIETNEEDFVTIHHELGHNFYQRAYDRQPPLFRDSANDGFHEAIGDTIALSITPKYLVDIGLIEKEPDSSKDIGLLLQKALDKVAFLPFGLLIDQWRWKVASGEISPADYNKAWWQLREKYQGIAPPVARSENDFDPGAKYHVPSNTPYTRYFLADILQFQFHRELVKAAGWSGPVHRGSIYGNAAAGKKLVKALEMGCAKPWPEVLEVLTGQKQMDATAILDYFAPLKKWLDEQNAGKPVGWGKKK
jgi:peptidyl-dipeptidase A